MTHSQIRALYLEGDTPAQILRLLTSNGYEFPDASAKIAYALKLKLKEVEQMEQEYEALS